MDHARAEAVLWSGVHAERTRRAWLRSWLLAGCLLVSLSKHVSRAGTHDQIMHSRHRCTR